MRIVMVSDTHTLHDQVKLPEGDVLLHAGDLTLSGNMSELRRTVDWLKSQPFDAVVAIAGNHDFALEEFMNQGREDLVHEMFYPVHYLRDSSALIYGKRFYGSPWQPWFYDWAFNVTRGKLSEYWDKIPRDTDVLITHGPPKGILDWVGRDRVGCEELLAAVKEIQPELHVFGHIHAAGGRMRMGMNDGTGLTTFVNASVLDDTYKYAHEPQIYDLGGTHERKPLHDETQTATTQPPS